MVSPGTRLLEKLSKSTNRPSADIEGPEESPLPGVPSEATLTRSVVCMTRSCTKTSPAKAVVGMPGRRLRASLENATKRPSTEMAGNSEMPSIAAPPDSALMRSVVPVMRSYTNTSRKPFVSPATRLLARLSKAMYRPSPEIEGSLESPSA